MGRLRGGVTHPGCPARRLFGLQLVADGDRGGGTSFRRVFVLVCGLVLGRLRGIVPHSGFFELTVRTAIGSRR
jgi:hypothetical protein